MFSACPFVRPSVRSFVCYQTCEHDILKTTEPILIEIGTSDPLWELRGQSSRSHEETDQGIILDPLRSSSFITLGNYVV